MYVYLEIRVPSSLVVSYCSIICMQDQKGETDDDDVY